MHIDAGGMQSLKEDVAVWRIQSGGNHGTRTGLPHLLDSVLNMLELAVVFDEDSMMAYQHSGQCHRHLHRLPVDRTDNEQLITPATATGSSGTMSTTRTSSTRSLGKRQRRAPICPSPPLHSDKYRKQSHPVLGRRKGLDQGRHPGTARLANSNSRIFGRTFTSAGYVSEILLYDGALNEKSASPSRPAWPPSTG